MSKRIIGNLNVSSVSTANLSVTTIIKSGSDISVPNYTSSTIGTLLVTNISAANGNATIGNIIGASALITNLSNTSLTSTSAIITNLSNTSLTSSSALITNLSNTSLTSSSALITNLSNTALTSGTIRASTLISSGNIASGNLTTVNLLGTTFSTGNIYFTGDLYKNGVLFTGSGSSQWTTTGANIFYTTGNVGIRNTAPNFTLDITGTLEANNSNGVILFASTGNLGIGTTSPSVGLELNESRSNLATIRIRENSSNTPTDGGGVIQLYGTRSTGAVGEYARLKGGRSNLSSNNHGFFSIDVSSNDGTTPVERLRIIENGNVGIGTTSPSYRLDVNGSLRATSGDVTLGTLVLTTGITAGNLLATNVFNTNLTVNNLRITSGSLTATFNSNTIGPIITSGGNVGIGTNPVSEALYINGSVLIDTGSAITSGRLRITSDQSINYIQSGTFNNSPAQLRIGGAPYSTNSAITIMSSGNVGIGNSNPGAPLDIRGSTTGGIILMGSDNSNATWRIATPSSQVVAFGGNTDHHTTFGGFNNATNAYTERMRVATTGDVGIGTTNPSSKLHVIGDIGLPYGNCIRTNPESASSWPSGTTKLIETNWSINGLSQDVVSFYTPGSISSVPRINISSNGVIHLNGNVGIGTTGPSSRLHVYQASGGDNSSVNVSLNPNSSSGTEVSRIQMSWYSDIFSLIGYRGPSTFYSRFGFVHNSSERLTIRSDGNIGIGTIDPGYQLTLTGSIGMDNMQTISAKNSSGVYETFLWPRWSDNQTYLNYGAGGFQIRNNNSTNIMFINNSGNIGIGTNNPFRAKLEVIGSVSNNVGTYGWLNSNGQVGQAGGSNQFYSIYGDGRIAGSEFNAFSDIRIKEQIQDINDTSALNILRQIEPKRYNYIDKISRGTKCVWGFIAQQVESVLNYSTGRSTGFIPNIYETADVNKNETGETNIVLRTKTTIALTSTSASQTSVKIKLYIDEQNTEKIVTLKEIIDEKSFIINEEIDNTNIVFVYGIEVSDFHTLNKDSIFTINVAATQEIDRQLQETKQELQETKQELQETKQELATLKAFLQSKFPGEF